MKILENSDVLLLFNSRKKWLARANSAKPLHTHLGIIDFTNVIGRDYGSFILTNLGNKIYLLEPTIYDYIMKSERKTQIVYPKDLGYIAIRTGMKNGSKIIEIGTGSAGLTSYMASIVKPEGHIFTFDTNPEFMKIAKKNLERSGMLDYVTMHNHDIKQGYELKDIDIAVVDLGDPWSVLEALGGILKNSGSFIAICPTMNQVEKTATELAKSGYIEIESIEIIIRNIEAREGKTRPAMRMIGHTTYLIFARKISRE